MPKTMQERLFDRLVAMIEESAGKPLDEQARAALAADYNRSQVDTVEAVCRRCQNLRVKKVGAKKDEAKKA